MGSHQVRMLLVSYLKLPVDRPSLVHSCVLGIAVKISSEYADFQFPQFLQMWGYDRYLREEDKQRQTGKDGRSYPSLMQRVERRLQSYALHHQSEMPHPVDGIKDMVAVKVFEKQMNGATSPSLWLQTVWNLWRAATSFHANRGRYRDGCIPCR